GPRVDPDAPLPILAGMLGVSAMAVQNALVQISLGGAPSTAVMTTNITRFMMDVGDVMLGHDADDMAKARSRAKRTFPAILGFASGCGLGAWCEAAFGLRALALPAGLTLLALAMARSARPAGARRE
ncbi:MAG TPA: YoaK family protein, partial [Acetobacteraceae bacterium]|nr:YoaK family protein [Acetobacteraceae bacterium]